MTADLATITDHRPLQPDDINDFLRTRPGALLLSPTPGDGSPEISWGDTFCYYAPDGVLPQTQPFATVVTKEYPDEQHSGLDRPGAFRVNVAAGRDAFVTATGRSPRDSGPPKSEPEPDTLIAHPVYGTLGWLAVLNPGPRTATRLGDLLTTAHDLARHRWDRRQDR